MKKTYLLLLIIVVLSGAGFSGFNMRKGPPKELEVHYIDVGQGNATLIRTLNGKNMLIDAGSFDSQEKLEEYLHAQGIKKLDVVIATHPDEDHIGGMANIIQNFEITDFYMPNKVHNTASFEQMISLLKRKQIPVHQALAKDIIAFDPDMEILVLNPDDRQYIDNNSYSIATKLTYNKNSFMFTGDIDAVNEYNMIAAFGELLDSDVLLLAHHGSSSSSAPDFIRAVSPQAAVASAGNKNPYGHPHKEVRLMLQSFGIPLYRTDEQGSIVFYSNGENISVNASNPGSYN